MNLKDLAAPFSPHEIKWRVGNTSKRGDKATLLAYIDARCAMDRLDDVCGPENWQSAYAPGPDGGIVCKVGVKVGDEWVWKEDGAEKTKVEAVKGGYSDAFKRACVPWGIARYLYRLPAEYHVIKDGFAPRGVRSVSTKKGSGWGYCEIPRLPAWALPKEDRPKEREAAATSKAASDEARQAKHDPSFNRAAFFASLPAGVEYDQLKAWCAAHGKPKPSEMPDDTRRKMVGWLKSEEGRVSYEKWVGLAVDHA